MSAKPYPGYPTTYRNVTEVGGYQRTCLVVEILSIGDIAPAQLALLKERLEATAKGVSPSVFEHISVVSKERFDRQLLDGLRLTN